MSQLAILGGEPIRRKPFAPWPQYQPSDIARIVRTVESRHWGGYPLPTSLATGFCKDFAAMHGKLVGFDNRREIIMSMPVVVIKDGKFKHFADIIDPGEK